MPPRFAAKAATSANIPSFGPLDGLPMLNTNVIRRAPDHVGFRPSAELVVRKALTDSPGASFPGSGKLPIYAGRIEGRGVLIDP